MGYARGGGERAVTHEVYIWNQNIKIRPNGHTFLTHPHPHTHTTSTMPDTPADLPPTGLFTVENVQGCAEEVLKSLRNAAK